MAAILFCLHFGVCIKNVTRMNEECVFYILSKLYQKAKGTFINPIVKMLSLSCSSLFYKKHRPERNSVVA